MNDIESNRRDERITRVEILRERHRKIHEEVATLSSRRYLSPKERMELKNLKVMKLRVKDAIENLKREKTQNENKNV